MNINHIKASIEVSAKHVLDAKLDGAMLPAATRVYVTDVGVDPVCDIVTACRKIHDMGYTPVPHIPARRIESAGALDTRLASLTSEAGVNDILLIAGEADRQMGPYSRSMALLETGLMDKYGIAHIGIAGHPEGNVAYGNDDVMNVLREKADFASNSDAQFRIVTQFGFDGGKFVQWAQAVADQGIQLPIHLGVAGPAKVTTLIKYAALCGVGNSLSFFKKRTGAIAQLATKHSPEDVVDPIEKAWRENTGNIAQMHVFPFGGLKASSDWLARRGSFTYDAPKQTAALASI